MADDPTRLHVVVRVAAPGPPAGALPVLLVHGAMDRATSFGRVQAHLADVTTIAYDRRGYGRSTGRAPSTRFDDQVDDLVEVLDGRAVVAVGHSFGGGIVLAAAARHPDLVRAAVVFEPPMPWLPWWPATSAGVTVASSADDPADLAEAFVRRLIGNRIWEHLPAATRARRRSEGPALVAELKALHPAPWRPQAVTVPVIVGTGSESRAHHRRATEELAAALPRGELVVLDGSHHGAHLSHAPELARLARVVARRAGVEVGTAVPVAAESTGPSHEEDHP